MTGGALKFLTDGSNAYTTFTHSRTERATKKYTPAFIARYSSSAVVSYFAGEDNEDIEDLCFSGSEDELGMENEEDDTSESEFEPPQGVYATVHAEIRHKSAKKFPCFSTDIAKVPPVGPSLQIWSRFLVACPRYSYFYMRNFKNKHSQNGNF